LRRDGSVSWVDLGEASVIDRNVAGLRKALNDSQLTDPATIRQIARALDAKLMLPVRKLLGNTRHVLLSPDGALNLLPFGALVDERGRYLIENYSFTYLTSGRDLLRLQVQAENAQAPVIFANPAFDTGVTSGNADLAPTDVSRGKRAGDFREEKWAALPATQEEAASIKAIMPDARVFTTTRATESALKQIEQPRILHIASHGFFLEDKKDEKSIENPLLRSGLILAGANKRQSGAGEDGILTSLETAGLDLWGTKLVVLSACDTGAGEVQNGEGVYGLRRALVLAGAESQLLSLWKVQDAAARDLMIEFYRRLQRGEGRTEALRQSQLTMLRGAKDLRRHPYFWASFIQSGDWRSIVSSKPNTR
jgi:CHAT domain-containing protein